MKKAHFAIFALVVGCDAEPDASSATHVRCTKGSDCVQLPDLIVPGQCRGEGITCALPESPPLAAGPPVSCAISDGGAISAEWVSELGEIDCPIGKCTAANPKIAIAPDGGVWAAVDLLMPPPRAQSAGVLGTGLVHFDGSGQRVSSVITGFASRLLGYAPQPGALGVRENGNVISVVRGRGPGAPGYDWVERDASGAVVGSRRLIERVTDARGLFADAMLLLGYPYEPVATASEADAGMLPREPVPSWELTLIGADGKLLWQKTRLPGVLPLTFDASSRRSFVRHGGIVLGFPEYSLAGIDPQGNVAWGHSLPDVWFVNVSPVGDGSVFVWSRIQRRPAPGEHGGTGATPLHRLDAAGAPLWTMDLDVQLAGAELFGGATTLLPSVAERAILVIAAAVEQAPVRLIAVSGDGLRCRTYTLDIPKCLSFERDGPDGLSICDQMGAVATDSGAYYFATRSSVGRLRFEELP